MGKPYIKNGTPVGTESLCKTCTYAHIITGYRESEQMTMCTDVNPNIVLPFISLHVHQLLRQESSDLEADAEARHQRRSGASQTRRLQSRQQGFAQPPFATRVNVDHDEDDEDDNQPLTRFAGGADNGYFIGRAPLTRRRSRFDPCHERKLM